MGRSSQILLNLEANNSSTSSSIESKLLFCKDDAFFQSESQTNPPNTKPSISSVPKSQFLGKVKNFLGVMSEANKRLQLVDNSKDFDIEVLAGTESEYIEMDLMLGVADLHTPEAVSAAESAINGHRVVIPLAASDSSDEDEDQDESEKNDSNVEDEKGACSPIKLKRTKPAGDKSSRNGQSGKRPKIVELS